MSLSESLSEILPSFQNTLSLEIQEGTAYVYFAFDIGFSINLDHANSLITSEKSRRPIKSKKRVGKFLNFVPTPIKITQSFQPIEFTGVDKTKDVVEIMLFDFGAVSVSFQIPLRGTLSDVLKLSEVLFDNPVLYEHAQKVIEHLVQDIRPAVQKLRIVDHVEDYIIFEFNQFNPALSHTQMMSKYADAFTCLLRSESKPLSEMEVQQSITGHLSYFQNDWVVVDWNSALVIDKDAEDVRLVLEFGNVALQEFSYLDTQLNNALDEFFDYFSKSRTKWLHWGFKSMNAELKKIGQFQIDCTTLFESVTNAFKLVGDEYLSRLYRLTSRKLGLTDWDQTISKKLATIESIYQKISDAQATQRLEILEWIIIVLIAFSILVSFI